MTSLRVKILSSYWRFLVNSNLPERLKINNRKILSIENFEDTEKLYHGYLNNELDENGYLKLETLRFPDFSCNWSKFSRPYDIWYRMPNFSKDEGCWYITVAHAKFENIALPVHDPIDGKTKEANENYSHTELRATRTTDRLNEEPPRNRRINNSKKKLEYRTHIRKNCKVCLFAK